MASTLQKFSILDPRVDMSKEFKRWVAQLGAKEVSKKNIPSNGAASNSSANFTIDIGSTDSVVLDRSNVDFYIPVTITLAGSASSGGNLYNPDYEGLRNRPVETIIKKYEFGVAGQKAAEFEVSKICHLIEMSTADGKNRQTCPCDQPDNCQSYGDYNGMNASPFAKRYDNTNKPSRRAMTNISVTSNTYNSAVLQTNLHWNMQDYPPFTSDLWHVGMSARPLTVTISFWDFLGRIWCRDLANHPQPTLTGITVTLGRPEINVMLMTLPEGSRVPSVQNFPYHQVTFSEVQTVADVTAGSTFNFSTGDQKLDYVPNHIYLCARPSDEFISSSVSNIVGTPDCFAELVDINGRFANRSGLMNDYGQVQLFEMSKANGLRDDYAYCDWVGEQGGNNTYPLRGSLLSIDPTRDLCDAAQPITVGLNISTMYSFTGHMKNISASTRTFTVILCQIMDGLCTILNGTQCSTGLGIISSISELRPLDLPYSEAVAMMAGDGGNAKSFFRGLWSKIKQIVPIIKKSGIVGNILGMTPLAPIAPVAKTLGWGNGMSAFGDGGEYAFGDGGEYAFGDGYKKKGMRRTRRAPKKTYRKRRGGYLM